jgi:hypothetical protein
MAGADGIHRTFVYASTLASHCDSTLESFFQQLETVGPTFDVCILIVAEASKCFSLLQCLWLVTSTINYDYDLSLGDEFLGKCPLETVGERRGLLKRNLVLKEERLHEVVTND